MNEDNNLNFTSLITEEEERVTLWVMGSRVQTILNFFYFSNFVIVLPKEHKPTVASPFTNIIIFNFPKKRNYLVDATTIGSINDQMFIQKHK